MLNEKSDQSSGSTSSSIPENVKQEADDLAKELLLILAKHVGDREDTIYGIDIKDLLVDLSVFIVNRDLRVMQHGIDVGKREK